jgi:hypothetical protein
MLFSVAMNPYKLEQDPILVLVGDSSISFAWFSLFGTNA